MKALIFVAAIGFSVNASAAAMVVQQAPAQQVQAPAQVAQAPAQVAQVQEDVVVMQAQPILQNLQVQQSDGVDRAKLESLADGSTAVGASPQSPAASCSTVSMCKNNGCVTSGCGNW